jgi:hypothetical protein
VIDADGKTVLVATSEGVTLYGAGESVPVSITPGRTIAVDDIFAKS